MAEAVDFSIQKHDSGSLQDELSRKKALVAVQIQRSFGDRALNVSLETYFSEFEEIHAQEIGARLRKELKLVLNAFKYVSCTEVLGVVVVSREPACKVIGRIQQGDRELFKFRRRMIIALGRCPSCNHSD